MTADLPNRQTGEQSLQPKKEPNQEHSQYKITLIPGTLKEKYGVNLFKVIKLLSVGIKNEKIACNVD